MVGDLGRRKVRQARHVMEVMGEAQGNSTVSRGQPHLTWGWEEVTFGGLKNNIDGGSIDSLRR